MEYRVLGNSGTVVSNYALGTMTFGAEADEAASHAILDGYVAAGGNFIDTADVYSAGAAEEVIGRWFAGRPGARDAVVLASKGRFPMGTSPNDVGTSRRHLARALDGSLRRLGVEQIDLYQMHAWDPITPIEETLRFLNDAVAGGKIAYYGFSNFLGWQLTKAVHLARAHGWTPPVTLQPQYSLLVRDAEKEVLPAVNAFGLGFLPWFPLYNGLFTGKFSRNGGPAQSRIMRTRSHLQENAPWDTIEAYERFCAQRGITMLEATFAWLLAQPGLTSVIAGATKPEQIVQNAQSATSWKPSDADVAEISALFA